MNGKRLSAIVGIFIATTIAWMVLGETTTLRSSESYDRLGYGKDGGGERATVQQLWGTAQVQKAPVAWTTHKVKQTRTNEKGKQVVEEVVVKDPVVLTKSRINTNLELEPRRKGLLWYSTYRVKFEGEYAFQNSFNDAREFVAQFQFPQGQAAFDNVLIFLNGKRQYPGGDLSEGVKLPITLKPGQGANLKVSYGSQGMDTWHYKFADDSVAASVRDFEAVVRTNTSEIDFPGNCLSPTHKKMSDGGWTLRWAYGDLISSSNIGVKMPEKLQPGPFASRLSLFAPVSLLFFFAMLMLVTTVRTVKLHPVHYLFLAATFFSFHLLFSYLVDHVMPFPAFLISSAVSLILTISYLRLVTGWKFAITQAGFWQFVFLVLFTYAFFFEGYTGLTITIGAIITLAAMMQLTGKVDWEETLAKAGAPAPPNQPVGPGAPPRIG
jgi:inner membrane protein involved in colicin E2 resistance